MSREIREVALDWEHPLAGGRYSDGSLRYVPLDAGSMPAIPEGAARGWQLYETVSEGSPLSPVCRSKGELAEWMSSPAAGRGQVDAGVAARFIEVGWAPSFFLLRSDGLVSGVEWVGAEDA